MTVEELAEGDSDEEAAAQFMRTYGEMESTELKDVSLRNQWTVSQHVLGCKKGVQAAQLAIYASKILKGEECWWTRQCNGWPQRRG